MLRLPTLYPHSIGRLYCLLFFSDKALTLDEMKEELGMRKASMSLAVRSLLDLNMVEKSWIKGVRKDLYIKWRPAVTMNTTAIEKTITELQELLTNSDSSKEVFEHAQNDINNLQNWLGYFDWLNRLIDSFETQEIFDFIPIDKKDDPKE